MNYSYKNIFSLRNLNPCLQEGYGIGDDEYSISYDGCRQQLWYTALNEAVDTRPPWQPGDVVGCLINVSEEYVSFYLNGHLVTKKSQLFTTARFVTDYTFVLQDISCLFSLFINS